MKNFSVRCRAAAVLGVCIAACAVQAPAAFAANQSVSLTNSDSFSPAAVTVAPGDTVTWNWAGSSHNVTADSGQADTFSSGTKKTGTFAKTFNTVGRFTYRCTLHSGMTGSVTVSSSTPTTDTTAPSAPTGLVATAADATVTIDWADSTASDFANYMVERQVGGTGAWSTIASPNTSVYTDTSVTNDTAYFYRVTAADITGNISASSGVVSATPVAPPPTTGPVTRHVTIANYVFAPAAITIKTGDTVAWDWSGSDLNHSVTSTSGTPSFDSHLGMTDSQITGAPAGGFSRTFSQVGSYTYFCRIHTNMTGTINVTGAAAPPDTTPPAAPGSTVATAADASVTIDWADSTAPDFSNYVVQRQVGGGAWTTVAAPVSSVFIDTAVTNGTSYSYRVTAIDMSGNVSAAGAVVVATPVAPPPPPVVAGPVTRHVAVAGYQYAPAIVTVNSGDTVEWDWTGSDVNHSVTSVGGLLETFESHLGALVNAILAPPAGGNYSHTFNQVGSFPYLCRVHPDMTGTVQVVASGAPDTQPTTPKSSPPPPAPAANVKPAASAKIFNVKVADFAFAPAKLSIALGDVVKWSWTGEDVNHSVTANAGQTEQFESHPGLKISEVTKAPAGGPFSHTFTNEGTFKYFCRVHPGMTGEITVGPAPIRVRIVKVKRGTGSLNVSYRLTKAASVKALVYRGSKRIVTKSTKGKSGANSVRIVLPGSARHSALKVILRGGTNGVMAQARATVRAVSR
jgi:plastocyanin